MSCDQSRSPAARVSPVRPAVPDEDTSVNGGVDLRRRGDITPTYRCHCPARPGNPVHPVGVYWIARSSRTMTAMILQARTRVAPGLRLHALPYTRARRTDRNVFLQTACNLPIPATNLRKSRQEIPRRGLDH